MEVNGYSRTDLAHMLIELPVANVIWELPLLRGFIFPAESVSLVSYPSCDAETGSFYAGLGN